MKSFCIAMSSLRKQIGLSQRQVASDLGISQALLSHYEKGAREPRLDFVVKACNYYGVSADYILGRSEERDNKTSLFTEVLNSALCGLQDLRAATDALIEKLEKTDSGD